MVPYDRGGAATAWVSETADRADTAAPVLGMLTVPTFELAAVPVISSHLVDDAQIDIVNWMVDSVGVIVRGRRGHRVCGRNRRRAAEGRFVLPCRGRRGRNADVGQRPLPPANRPRSPASQPMMC